MKRKKPARNRLCFMLTACMAVISGHNNACLAYSGATAFESLKINAGARPSGMGGASAGLADDINAINYNPAGLGFKDKSQMSFTHNQWFEDISQQYIAYLDKRGFGLSLNYLNYGKTARTTISNTRGIGLGEFGGYDLAFNIAYGKNFSENINFGADIKYLRGKISDYTGSAVALDMGLLYSGAVDKLTLGLVLQNIGTKAEFGDTDENLPVIFKIGSAYKIFDDKLVVLLDLSRETRNPAVIINSGAEYLLNDFLALRTGLNARNKASSGITAGLGINYSNFSFDYAYSPYSDLGAINQITLTYRLK